ncbi:MAG TPA: hypothetical protein VKD72_00930, partial [Gemmataceae bacterium]|nr:hypothetical protein [Gemmataceae bacterium]
MLFNRFAASTNRKRRASRPRFVPSLQPLEGRLVPATTLFVNTFADAIAADGRLSLREAIDRANVTPGPDVIQLQAGTYRITLAGSNVTNAAGDFDVTDSLTIIGKGAGLTTIEGNAVGIRERLFEAIGLIDLRIANLALRNGGNDLSNGGAVQTLSANITLNGCLVTGMRGLKGGSINAESGNVTLNNSTVTNSASIQTGGAINAASGDVTLNSSTVSKSSAGQGSGGGILASKGKIVLRQSAVRNCTANFGAGLAAFDGDVTLVNSTVANNRAGGAIGGGIFASTGDVVLVNSRVTGNSTFGDNGFPNLDGGGGIFAGSGNVKLDTSSVSDNVASESGGGIFAQSGNVTLSRSAVCRNRARDDGGGIAAMHSLVTVSVLNGSSVRHNVAGDPVAGSGRGGGIYSAGMLLANSIVSGNVAFHQGGGFFAPTKATLIRSTV